MQNKATIKEYIEEGEVHAAQKMLLEFIEKISYFEEEVIVGISRINNLQNEDSAGTISHENKDLTRNRLSLFTLQCCGKIEHTFKHYFPKISHDFVNHTLSKQIELSLQDKYDKVKDVFDGAAAAFYKFEERISKRMVMIRVSKQARTEGDRDEGDKEILKRALKINHRNIVKILDIYLEANPNYVIMEYVQGISLDRLLRRLQFSRYRAIAIIKELCEAINYLHINGIVHGNLKPDKVLIDNELKPVISFFDIANSSRASRPNIVSIESFMYASPETIKGTVREADSRSDQFSLGLLLYELLGGTPLFYPDTSAARLDIQGIFEMRIQFFKNKSHRTKKLKDTLPDDLVPIITRMLSEDPRKRYNDLGEVLKDLNQLDFIRDTVTDIAVASYERCCIFNPDFIKDFYESLFKKHPRVADFFKTTDSGGVPPRLHKMLLLAIELIIHYHDDEAKISSLRNNPFHANIHFNYFSQFFEVLLEHVYQNDYILNNTSEHVEKENIKQAWKTIMTNCLKTIEKIDTQNGAAQKSQ